MHTRVQKYVPADIVIPDIVKPVFDDSYIEISDTQTWHKTTPQNGIHCQTFEIKPSVMADIVTSSGKLVVKPGCANDSDAENKPQSSESCVHTLTGECRVAVPFLGWYVEQAIIGNMQTFYKQYPGYIQRFVEMVVNRWGNGHPSSLRRAVDKMLAEEKASE